MKRTSAIARWIAGLIERHLSRPEEDHAPSHLSTISSMGRAAQARVPRTVSLRAAREDAARGA